MSLHPWEKIRSIAAQAAFDEIMKRNPSPDDMLKMSMDVAAQIAAIANTSHPDISATHPSVKHDATLVFSVAFEAFCEAIERADAEPSA